MPLGEPLQNRGFSEFLCDLRLPHTFACDCRVYVLGVINDNNKLTGKVVVVFLIKLH